VQFLREVKVEGLEQGFELHLAIVNAFGEKGDVAGVRAELEIFMEKFKHTEYAATYGYVALLKALRCALSWQANSRREQGSSPRPH
jgi:hypothetical protein